MPRLRRSRSVPRSRIGLGKAITFTLAGALLLVGVLGYGGLWLLGFPEPQVAEAEPLATFFDLLKVVFAFTAGVGAVVALVVAYRKQRVAETELFTDRFTKAADQLGSPQAAVRLAGVYAMAALADDAELGEQRQSCIDVLCAYLRMPYTPEPAVESSPHPAPPENQRLAADGREERQVRHTIIRVITRRLRDGARVSWCGYDFDFTGAVFDGDNFSGARFSGGGVSFADARFSGGTVDFIAAKFSADIVDFSGAQFSAGTVDFSGAQFSAGIVNFSGAQFSADIVNFSGAQFSGAAVLFIGAQFSAGIVNFSLAQFSAGTVKFTVAQFSGAAVDFTGATFSGAAVDFTDAQFSGAALHFGGAKFSAGSVDFDRAEFSGGTVDFGNERFSGTALDFIGAAQFSGGTVDFTGARFSGGTVDLSSSSVWDVPPLFDAMAEIPDGLLLPEGWRPPRPEGEGHEEPREGE